MTNTQEHVAAGIGKPEERGAICSKLSSPGIMSSDVVFHCRDVRGRPVELTRRQWDQHILPRHPELQGQEQVVREAVERPDGIYRDVNRTARECYYMTRQSFGRPLAGINFRLIKVVVDFHPMRWDEPGEVITSYVVSQVKPREVRLWP